MQRQRHSAAQQEQPRHICHSRDHTTKKYCSGSMASSIQAAVPRLLPCLLPLRVAAKIGKAAPISSNFTFFYPQIDYIEGACLKFSAPPKSHKERERRGAAPLFFG